MTDKEIIGYIEQHAFISDEVKDIMLMLIKERNYCATLPDDIVKVKDLIGYLRCVPSENVLMVQTDAEDVLERTDIVIDIDDVLLGHGTNHGICYLKLTGLKELTNKVKEETINEFAEKLNNEISKFVLEHKDNLDFASGISVAWNMVDETAEEMKKELVNERK